MRAAPAAAEIVDVSLTEMAHGGEALGRADDGLVVLAGGGIPGERVRVRVSERHRRFGRGTLAAYPAEPSPERVDEPACRHFGRWPDRGDRPGAFCGGCQWQHVSYPAQLRYKADLVRDALRRQGGLAVPPVHEATGMAAPWGYRNHVRLRAGPWGTGLVALDGRAVVPISSCPIAHPLVGELVEALLLDTPDEIEIHIRAGAATGDTLIAIRGDDAALDALELETTLDTSVVLARPDGSLDVAAGRPFLSERLGDHAYEVPPLSFFQANTAMAEELLRRIGDCLPARATALLDVYAGVGVFTVAFAGRADEVYSIEADGAAVAAAVRNAEGLDNVTVIEGDAGEALEYLAHRANVRATAAVVDPPRGGIDPPALRLLSEIVTDTMVYVSCDAVTLARDVRTLAQDGWRLEDCWPIDMFPHTHHVESVSLLRRQGT